MASTEFAKPQAAPGTEMYTRGAPGEPDNRGETMVQKHLNRLQEEKENASLAKLAALMPQMGGPARALALNEVDWDVEAALGLLRQFQVANLEKLNALSKKRKKLQEQAEEEEEEASSSDSEPEQAASSSASSSDESEDERAHKRKRKSISSSKKTRKSSDKKRSKRSKSEKDKSRKRSSRDRDRGKERESKRARRAASPNTTSDQPSDAEAAKKHLSHSRDYGRYGVLREGDAAARRDEFVLWAQDEKKVAIEQLQRWEEKELFAEFMEDFNTGTLPHRKYYDLQAYAREQALKAQKKAAAQQQGRLEAKSARDDEEEVRRMRMAERAAAGQELTKAAYERLKKGGLADEMRQQEMLRAQMALAYKTGDKEKAAKIMKRLEPDEEKKKRL